MTIKFDETKELENRISRIVAHYKNLSKAMAAAEKAGTMNRDGPLHKAIWESFRCMVYEVDTRGWIEWFIWENQCGKRGLGAGFVGNRKPIRTARQLAKIILADEKQ